MIKNAEAWASIDETIVNNLWGKVAEVIGLWAWNGEPISETAAHVATGVHESIGGVRAIGRQEFRRD